MTDCPGVCNAAWRATSHGEPIQGDPWCSRDKARIRRQLAELDDLAALLAMAADGHREQGTEPGRTNGHAPSPSPFGDTQDELLRVLLAWEDAYRELPEHSHWLTRPRRGILADVRTGTISWLCDHLDGILATDLAVDFGREVAWWHRSLTRMTKAGTGRHRGLIDCPHCKLRLLSWADGDDHLACGNCGRYMSWADYREEVDATRRNLEQAS